MKSQSTKKINFMRLTNQENCIQVLNEMLEMLG